MKLKMDPKKTGQPRSQVLAELESSLALLPPLLPTASTAGLIHKKNYSFKIIFEILYINYNIISYNR